ncbi:FtsB family cell division protein [Henriciella aquimarina]|uniref:FtsB family cell division protein n=1 Tax=Henriciella aquimarina TaxID=545261 RepID=UPI0009FC1B07|nr:septum formation initiator family protein [Henriciella aquimarina]
MAPKYAAAAMCALTAYFAYHAFAGEQGLGHWSDMQATLETKEAELSEIRDANDQLRADIARLTPGTVDPDLVEALARDDLGFAYPDEIILMSEQGQPAF